MDNLLLLAFVVGLVAWIIISNLKSSSKSKSFQPNIASKNHVPDSIIITCKNQTCQQELKIPNLKKELKITCPRCESQFLYSPNGATDKIVEKEKTSRKTKKNASAPKYVKKIQSVSDKFSTLPKKRTISISKIKDSECPFKYFKNYIEDPKEKEPFLSIELGLGQFFHGKAEQLFKKIWFQHRAITKNDIINIDNIINEFEISFLWDGKLREPYRFVRNSDFDYFKSRLENITRNFNKYVVPKLNKHEVLKTEGSLEIKTKDFVIRGKYDLLTKYNNDYIVWDWKSWKKPDPTFYKDFTLQKIQLGIYAIWARHKYGIDNVCANVVFLREGAELLKESFKYDLEEKTINYIADTHQHLNAITDFVPIPNNLCPWCSWNEQCANKIT